MSANFLDFLSTGKGKRFLFIKAFAGKKKYFYLENVSYENTCLFIW